MELQLVGRILGPHGIDGLVKALPVDESIELLEELTVWSLGFAEDSVVPHTVEECRRHVSSRGTSLIVRLDGVASRTGAELLKGARVFAPASEVESLRDGSSDQPRWIGYRVVDKSGTAVGEVVELRPMPAQDLLIVRRPGRHDAMIPCVPEFIEHVDAEKEEITVNLPEGLLD